MQASSTRTGREPEATPSFWEATAELVSAGQEVVLDRVELLRTEIAHDLQHVIVGIGLVSAGLFIAVFGWVLAMAALVVVLSRAVSLDLAFALVGVPHLAAGVVLALFAVRQFQTLEITGGAEENNG